MTYRMRPQLTASGALLLALLAGCGERIDTPRPAPPTPKAEAAESTVAAAAPVAAAPEQPSTQPGSTAAAGSSRPGPRMGGAAARDDTGIATAIRDVQITARVTAGLSVDKRLSASPIQVATEAGVVKLQGRAPSEEARARAVEIASHVDGVDRVSNQLEVREATTGERPVDAVVGTGPISSQSVPSAPTTAVPGSSASDIEITMKVSTGMSVDRELASGRVEVNTRGGVVTLSGTAPNDRARQRAEQIARHVERVEGVKNELKVIRPG
ncbi:BON domain-containing protein [Ramlibacter sp. AW1]|uniref:BON domain-containing protein n=1 Tax=Ramlibacter aurantiacus TaxID=2801330 RepID=A0A936ZTW2_9BURK|nr:BON domain-containing protein [Ramlibacter aurantiacus]MBL0420524.1 BON domain-containing protein [Ramlibacter aurantiacus]